MAKEKKVKKVKKPHKPKLNPLVKLALGNELKKHIESPEEREKVMQAFASLDMQTLMTDPEALARVMANPAAELRNFVADGVDPDAEIVDTASVTEATEPNQDDNIAQAEPADVSKDTDSVESA